MDVIFHRNCLDGVFSSFIAYLASKLIDQKEIDNFLQQMNKFASENVHDLTGAQPHQKINQQNQTAIQKMQITEDFFHKEMGVYFNAYSFFAGEYFPLKFPGNAKILFVVDTNLGSIQNIENVCKSHQIVVMIDHHTSFKDMKNEVISHAIKNFFYVFDEGHSASELCLNFMNKYFSLQKRLQAKFYNMFSQEILYVAANDTKRNETRQSKAFILGFYDFGVELSHTNPNLYKRVGLMDLGYLLQKGKNLYVAHIKEIQDQVSRAKICEFNFNGPFKNKRCLYLEPRNAYKISDFGTVLAFLSAQGGMENLAFLCMKKYEEIRCSTRSHRAFGNPKALQLAKVFGGGGHTEAAGFKLMPGVFKSKLKINSASNINLNLSVQKIEGILFGEKS